MTDINWGLLQPLNQMAPIHSASPQANPAPMGGGSGGGQLDPLAQQKLAIEQQRLGIEQNADKRAQALLPGTLESTRLGNEGQALTNKTAQMTQAASELAVNQAKDRIQAYSRAEQTGGSKIGQNYKNKVI